MPLSRAHHPQHMNTRTNGLCDRSCRRRLQECLAFGCLYYQLVCPLGAFWELCLAEGIVGSATDRRNELEGQKWEVPCFPPGSSELTGVLPLLLICFDYFSMPSYSCS